MPLTSAVLAVAHANMCCPKSFCSVRVRHS